MRPDRNCANGWAKPGHDGTSAGARACGSAYGASRRPIATLRANADLIVLFVLIVADVRLFDASAVASFTLVEIFIWGYCAPVVAGHLFIQRRKLPVGCVRFVVSVGLYMAWLLFVSAFALVFRDHSDVLQNTKNILPALVLCLFVFYRVRDRRTVALLCNLYVAYSVLSCLLGLMQYLFDAPYVRPLIQGTQYKLDIDGGTITHPVVGLSGHPNEFAMAILPGLCLAIFQFGAEIRDYWRLRPMTVLVTGLLCLGMLLSQARGALLFTAAAILFMTSPLGRTRSWKLKLAWTAGLITLVVVYGLHAAQDGEAAADTIEVRYLLWKTSVLAITSDPYVMLFGDGTAFVKRWSFEIANWQFPDAHNAWLDQILVFGFLALPLYLSIWRRFFTSSDAASQRAALGT